MPIFKVIGIAIAAEPQQTTNHHHHTIHPSEKAIKSLTNKPIKLENQQTHYFSTHAIKIRSPQNPHD